MRIVYLFVAALTLSLVGCTSTAKLNTIQASNTYPNKIKLRALLYIPSDIKTSKVVITSSTNQCTGYTGEVDAGAGYQSAIENGLKAAFTSVELVETPPTPEMAASKNADIIISVTKQNENSSMNVNSGGFTSTLSSQFQISFNLQIAGKDGTSLYSYVANGSGFGNVSGSCNDLASAMQPSMETALRQVADNISQGTYGAAQIREYEKAR